MCNHLGADGTHKQILEIVPGLDGWRKSVVVFFGVIPYGEKTHRQNPPESRDNTFLFRPCHAKPSLTKPPFPIFFFFHFCSRWLSACSDFLFFRLHFCCSFLCFTACPELIRMFRIFYGLKMRKLGWLALSGMGLGATHLRDFLGFLLPTLSLALCWYDASCVGLVVVGFNEFAKDSTADTLRRPLRCALT